MNDIRSNPELDESVEALLFNDDSHSASDVAA